MDIHHIHENSRGEVRELREGGLDIGRQGLSEEVFAAAGEEAREDGEELVAGGLGGRAADLFDDGDVLGELDDGIWGGGKQRGELGFEVVGELLFGLVADLREQEEGPQFEEVH